MTSLPMETRALECAVLRGGTSRGVFFAQSDLDFPRHVVERILLNVFGSPDSRQINGLGGATSVTSKAAIVGPSSHSEADVDYTFAQVGVADPVVDWGGNCGNISSAVGPYAVNHGLVAASGTETTVRIHNTNTGKLLHARVPLVAGRAAVSGECVIPGVPGAAARVMLEFIDPGGSVTGQLLPTGRERDEIKLADGRSLTVSVVDAGNPLVFLLAGQLGLSGTEQPNQLAAMSSVMAILEEVRGTVATWLGLVDEPSQAANRSPGLPKIGFVAPPSEFTSSDGRTYGAADMDLTGRLLTMQTPHQSFMAAGAICTTAAALVQGTVVHEVARATAPDGSGRRALRIGHPYGVMRTDAVLDEAVNPPVLKAAAIERTAREIMTGVVHVPAALFEES